MNTISASQLDTYGDCNRFWWFQRILKLAEPPAAHFTFGTVLHGVCERWIYATANGRVRGPAGATVEAGPHKGQIAGRPVNLYPEGWDTATERDGSTATVTPTEARLIKKLVAEAIEEGILRRSKQATVERKILVNVIEGVNLIGYIDVHRNAGMVHELPMIEDHKSYGKGSVRYLKRENSDSPNFLGANQQLKTYAWAIDQLDNSGGDGIRVRHNQFPKFPGRPVTAVEATITAQEIAEHGEWLAARATQMERTRKIKKWEDVPGPTDTGKCDRWYGKPCPFSKICGRMETPEGYKVRVSRLIEGQGSSPRLDLPLQQPRKRGKAKEATGVSIFDRAEKQKAARAERKAKAGVPEAKAKASAPAEPKAPAQERAETPAVVNGAPWANPKCKACKGRGLTSKGKACPICDNTAKRGGRPTSLSYVVEVDDEGQGIAVAREEAVEELEAAGLTLEWFEGEPAQEPAEAAQEPADEAPAAEEPEAAVEAPPAEEPQEEPQAPAEEPPAPTPAKRTRKAPVVKAKAKGGRPSVGLTILVGSVPIKGAIMSRTVVTSTEVLARFGAELAADMGAESYYDLDSFKRRDRLAQKADYIVNELARQVLIHPGVLGNDDAGTLVQALMAQDEGVDAVYLRTS